MTGLFRIRSLPPERAITLIVRTQAGFQQSAERWDVPERYLYARHGNKKRRPGVAGTPFYLIPGRVKDRPNKQV
jgi:hypothetical protein